MPASAAHYAFGKSVIKGLSAEILQLISENKNYFILGTQGPDLLFYHKPLSKSEISKLGHDIHSRSAEDFLSNCLKKDLKNNPPAFAYLLGFCCHYGLDRSCHPYVYSVVGDDNPLHISLETDFDKFIIKKHNLSLNRQKYLPIVSNVNQIAMLYDISEAEANSAMENFRRLTKLLDNYKFVKLAEKAFGKNGHYSNLSINKPMHYHCEAEELYRLFEGALLSTCDLLSNFYTAVMENLIMPDDFKENFDGIII